MGGTFGARGGGGHEAKGQEAGLERGTFSRAKAGGGYSRLCFEVIRRKTNRDCHLQCLLSTHLEHALLKYGRHARPPGDACHLEY